MSHSKKFKKIFFWPRVVVPIVVAVVVLSFFVGGELSPRDDRIVVAASFYPLQYFAEQITGDRAVVKNLVPLGSGPHFWEPTPPTILDIRNADIVIYVDDSLEMWTVNILREIGENVIVVEVSYGIELLHDEFGHEHEEHDMNEEYDEKHDEIYDPHIWLDPVIAKSIVDRITDALVLADPRNANHYRDNAVSIKERLDGLDLAYSTGLSNCEKPVAITSHAAFSYVAERYGFQQIPISGLSHEEEPSAAKIRELVQIARDHGIKYIYYETLVNPRVSETIAAEVGASVLILDPIEGVTEKDLSEGRDWYKIMLENLENLRIGLECK